VKIVKSLFICFFSFASFAQTNLLLHKVDTLKADFRSGGKSNDSLDLYFAEKQTTLPGGTQNNPFGVNGNDYFNFFQSLTNQYRSTKIASPIFTALPHLGFMYSVGSGGLQYLHADFQQTFRGNLHFSMHYNRQVSSTLYKQSDFSADAFTFSLVRYGKHWKHLIEGSSSKFVRALNGGVSSDNKMLDSYGLEYAPIYKAQAKDSSNRYFIQQQSVWNFMPVDSLSKIETGLVFLNQLQVDRRIYRETDSIAKLYPFFSNPTFTRDISQWSFLESGVSYFFKSKRQISTVGINRVYWMYKTNASQIKNAINITLNSSWNFGNTKLNYAMMQNLVGQGKQFSHAFQLTNTQKYGVHVLELTNSQMVPEPLQRLYFGNTIAWKIPTVEKQGLLAMAYSFSRKSTWKPLIKVGYKQMQNTYFLLQDSWRNDTLTNLQQVYISTSCDISLGKFHVQPRITLNYLNKNISLLPKYDLRARLFFKTTIKHKEKYEFIVGADVYTKSSYALMNFDSPWGLYSVKNPTNLYYTSVVQLDAFIGVSIDEIRFYFKYENMDNAWNPRANRVAINYPVMPKILRIGLTWDFLN
jgi:hypothetical protein